jgi:propionyl-CoA carboxylase alpha chain
VTHNIPLLRDVISNPRFVKGALTTAYLKEEYPDGFQGHKMTDADTSNLTAVVASIWAQRQANNYQWVKGGGSFVEEGLSKAHTEFKCVMRLGEGCDAVPVGVRTVGAETFEVDAFGQKFGVRMNWTMETSLIRADVTGGDGVVHSVIAQYLDVLPLGLRVSFYGTKIDVSIETELQHELSVHMKEKEKMDLTKMILSPMPGICVSVNVKVGDEVVEGGEIAVVEAMKMQNVLRAAGSGVVKFVRVGKGDSVMGDEVLVELE